MSAYADLDVHPQEVAEWLAPYEGAGWRTAVTASGVKSWTLSGDGVALSRIQVSPARSGEEGSGLRVVAEGNLARLLHGESGKALTLPPEEVAPGLEAFAQEAHDCFPLVTPRVEGWRVTRVDASATWAVQPESVGWWVTATNHRNRAEKGRRLAVSYGAQTASLRLNKHHYERVYDKGAEYLAGHRDVPATAHLGVFSPENRGGHAGSRVLASVADGTVGLVRAEVELRSARARRAYGESLADLSRHVGEAVAMVDQCMASAAAAGRDQTLDELARLHYFLSVAETVNEGVRLSGLWPVWSEGGVQALRGLMPARTATRLAGIYRRCGAPGQAPGEPLVYEGAVFAGRD